MSEWLLDIMRPAFGVLFFVTFAIVLWSTDYNAQISRFPVPRPWRGIRRYRLFLWWRWRAHQ